MNPDRELRYQRRVLVAAAVFALVGLLLQWWRLQVLTASYDQGIFLQVLWNGLRGHPFESTLSSQLSTNVIHAGQLPALGYHRLGQHFTPILMLWIPFVALLGIWALPIIQIGLITAAGLALHGLARDRLEAREAAWIACSFFGANAVLGPTWGNFTDLCQLPLAFFLLILGLGRRNPWLVGITALLIPLIREDTGVLLVAVAIWLVIREPRRWALALVLAVWGAGWVVLVTNGLMPLFSEDTSKRFMVENFGQYIGDQDQASSLEVLSSALRQPLQLLRELVSPPRATILYLLGQGLPLMFIPLISLDSWLLMGLPLLGLLLARGNNNPLSINIRYTFLVVPGLFSGAVMWWQNHPQLMARRRLRAVWLGCILLSILFTLTSNPNRSLSFLIPDSVQPWLYRPPAEQWQHGQAARRLLGGIPKSASVAANTPLVPHLAEREALVRFPESHSYLDRKGNPLPVQWIAVDLSWLQRFQVAFKTDKAALRNSFEQLSKLKSSYGVEAFEDGVALLKYQAADNIAARKRLTSFIEAIKAKENP